LRQQQFIRQTKRKVLNFNEDKRQQATQMPEIQEPEVQEPEIQEP
jgi:hypothetical protein